eukprot:INCI7460.1.p1 GENE.INCI7460.1~~INCI7460.1.p1  ORF type:complete len:275 (-),score=31.22 INCI7460.1:885-1709(-)
MSESPAIHCVRGPAVVHVDVGDADECSRCCRVTDAAGNSLTLFVCDGPGDAACCPHSRSLCPDCCFAAGLATEVNFFACDLCVLELICKQNFLVGRALSSTQRLLRDYWNAKARKLKLRNTKVKQLWEAKIARRVLKLLGYGQVGETLERLNDLDSVSYGKFLAIAGVPHENIQVVLPQQTPVGATSAEVVVRGQPRIVPVPRGAKPGCPFEAVVVAKQATGKGVTCSGSDIKTVKSHALTEVHEVLIPQLIPTRLGRHRQVAWRWLQTPPSGR